MTTPHLPTPTLAPRSNACARLLCLAIALALALPPVTMAAPGVAAAQSNAEKVETLSAEGAALFKAGKPKEAIAKFKEAYAIEPVANLLYNIALIYDRSDDLDNAIVYYEKFIISSDADPEVRARALERSKELVEARKRRQNNAVSTLPPDGNGGNGNGGNKGDGGKGTKDGDGEGLGTLATTGIITAGAGVLMVGTGAVFGLLAQSDVDAFEESRDLAIKTQAEDDARSNALTADILFVGGGLAIAAGAGMLIYDLTSGPKESPSTSTRITPVIGADTVGAAVTIPLF